MSRPPRSWLPVRRCLQTLVTVARMAERAGEAAGFKLKAHAHMLRHACGFALANKGHDRGRFRPTSATGTSSGDADGLQLFDASRCRSFARPSLVTLSAGRVFPVRTAPFSDSGLIKTVGGNLPRFSAPSPPKATAPPPPPRGGVITPCPASTPISGSGAFSLRRRPAPETRCTRFSGCNSCAN